MADSEPFRWLPRISQLSRRLPLPIGTNPPAQPQEPPDKAPLSSFRSSSVPPTAHPYLRDEKPISVHHGLAGPSLTLPAFRTSVAVESGSSSSDASSSNSYESSSSISGSHLHIGIPSPVTAPPKCDARARFSLEGFHLSAFDIRSSDPLEVIWKKLEAKSDEVREIRAEILRLRRKAQRRRLRRDAADNIFMSFLRPLLLCSSGTNLLATSQARLRELFDHMQKARDKCQDVETTLESMEEKLGYAEDQLKSAEKSLINEVRPGAAAQNNGTPPEPMSRRAPSPIPPLLLGIGAERPEDFHPLYKKFMSAVGYLQLAEEHHQDLFFRKQSIEREQGHLSLAQDYRPNDYNAINKQLETQDLKFLRDFDIHMRENLLEMERLCEEVERLRQMCQDRGVFPKHASLHEAYRFERDLGDDLVLNFGPSEANGAGPLFTSRFAVLLYSPNHLIEDTPITAKTALKRAVSLKDGDPLYPSKAELFASAAKEYLIEHLIQDANETDKTDFINRWLLHRLRTSAVEVELLYSLFMSSSSLTILNLEQWQQDVLFYWTRDEQARLPPERYVGPVTSEYTQGQHLVSGSSVKSSLQSDPPEEPRTAAHSTS